MNILLRLSFDVVIYFAEACIHPLKGRLGILVAFNTTARGLSMKRAQSRQLPSCTSRPKNILLGKEAAIFRSILEKKIKHVT